MELRAYTKLGNAFLTRLVGVQEPRVMLTQQTRVNSHKCVSICPVYQTVQKQVLSARTVKALVVKDAPSIKAIRTTKRYGKGFHLTATQKLSLLTYLIQQQVERVCANKQTLTSDQVQNYTKEYALFKRDLLQSRKENQKEHIVRKSSYALLTEWVAIPGTHKGKLLIPKQDLEQLCCYNALETYTVKHYVNERNKYHLPKDQFRLSKLQIKVAIYYHFLIDEYAMIPRVTWEHLAETFSCSIKALKVAHKLLQEYGFINYTHINGKAISVYIPNTKTYALTAQEGGSGYLTMSQATLFELIDVKNVNIVRATIRTLIQDTLALAKQKNMLPYKPTKVKLIDAAPSYPKYLRYPKALKDLYAKLPSILDCKATDKGLFITQKLESMGKYVQEKLYLEHKPFVEQLIDHIGLELSDSIKESSIYMCVQYGKNLLEQGMYKLKEQLAKDNGIQSIGAYLRTTLMSLKLEQHKKAVMM